MKGQELYLKENARGHIDNATHGVNEPMSHTSPFSD